MLKGTLFYQCKKCLKLNAATLPCGHQYCQNCIVQNSQKLSLEQYIEEFHCPECNKSISINFVRVFFMDDEEFIVLIDKITSCAFCQKSKRKLVELPCLDRLCEFCLNSMINSAKSYSEIICRNCTSYIKPTVYKDFILKENYEALFINPENFPLNAKVNCPRCTVSVFIKSALNTCTKCAFKFCVVCFSDRCNDTCLRKKDIQKPGSAIRKNVSVPPQKFLKKDALKPGSVVSKARINPPNALIAPVLIPPKEINDDFQKKKNSKGIQLSACDKCKKNEGQSFNCPHKFCLDCLRIKAEESYKKGEIDLIKCDCGIEIPETAVAESFGSKSIYLHTKEKYLLAIIEEADAIKFTCGICMGKYKIDIGITLDCDHRYCEECMKQYFTERISSSNVSEKEFVCPDCQNPVEHNIIRGVVGDTLYEKYLNFAFRNWRPEEGNILKYCAFCEGAAEIQAESKYFKCPKCKRAYCPQCNQEHDQKIDCDDYAQMKEEEKKHPVKEKVKEEEKKIPQAKGNPKNDFQEIAQNKNKGGNYARNNKSREQKEQKEQKEKKEQKNVKKVEPPKNKKKTDLNKNENNSLDYVMKNCKQCPKCKQFVEKDSGCNFIKCRWPGCTDSYFCFLCGIGLTVIII